MLVGDCGVGERVVLCWMGQGQEVGVEAIEVCVFRKLMVLLTRVGGTICETTVFLNITVLTSVPTSSANR